MSIYSDEMNKANLCACKIVRNIMKLYGYSFIWTNKYPKCRTVKVWARPSMNRNGMQGAIQDALEATGFAGRFEFKTTGGGFRTPPSFIVRIAR